MADHKYTVGYGRPPVEHQFRPGQSGNPAGRKKGSKNVATLVERALGEMILVNINGRRKKVSKLEAAFMQQANKAAAGDPKAVRLMLDVLTSFQRDSGEEEAGDNADTGRKRQHEAILANLKARLKEVGDGEEI